ncbi:hypothetical protein DP175_07270 [Polynucleobacter paneuropaeus]|nr:hypothetical protein [Polynucleobacter paneuropaeus]RAZ47972.1 hypothetical protein DP175_07270 [Polynucleobacter paneuropaeus]
MRTSFPKIILLSLLVLAFGAHAESTRFIALGDMPYSLPKDLVRYERLIKAINADKPAFSIFVGDTKSGDTPCSDEYMEKTTRYFNSFDAPLIYSIGDNEWTDCHRTLAGGYDPIERLERIRKTQFVDQNSFGKRRISLTRQADVMPQFAKFVENSLWVKGKFVFVSLHIPGSNNNYERTPASTQEYLERNAANLAWIEYAFQLAQKKKFCWHCVCIPGGHVLLPTWRSQQHEQWLCGYAQSVPILCRKNYPAHFVDSWR